MESDGPLTTFSSILNLDVVCVIEQGMESFPTSLLQGMGTNLLWRCSLCPTSWGLGSSRKHATRLNQNAGPRAGLSSRSFFIRWGSWKRFLQELTGLELSRARNTIWRRAPVKYSLHRLNKSDDNSVVSLSRSEREKLFWSGDCNCDFYVGFDSQSDECRAFIL